jgi:hypothetical protein
MRPSCPIVYKFGTTTGVNPRSGYFTTNSQLMTTTSVLRISVNDLQCMSHVYELQSVQGGSMIGATLRSNETTKFIFKVVNVLPPYVVNSIVQSYTFNVSLVWGSQYNPIENCDEFYIDFGIVDTMPHQGYGYTNPCGFTPEQLQYLNMMAGSPTAYPSLPAICPPTPSHTTAVVACHCQKPNPHPHVPCTPHVPTPPHTCSSQPAEVLETYASNGSFLYKFDNNYAAIPNPVITDCSPGTFKINGSSLDGTSFIQISVSDGSTNPTNNATYLSALGAGSTICLYSVTTGKRCIYKLVGSATQTTASISNATQTTVAVNGSYMFRVSPISTNYGMNPVSGELYIVTCTISNANVTTQLLEDLIPAPGQTVSIGSLTNALKDVFIGPDSLYISTYKFSCNPFTGSIQLINTAGSLAFDFTKIANTVSTLSSYVTSPVTGGGGGGVSGPATLFDGKTLVSSVGGVYSVNSAISTSAAFLGSPLVASNVSTTGSAVSAVAAGANYVLTKSQSGLATWAPVNINVVSGVSFAYDNSMIVSTASGLYTVTSTISTAAGFLGSPDVASNVSTTGSAVSAVAGGANYVLTKTTNGLATWAPPPAGGSGGSGGGSSFVGDNSMIVSSVSGVYTVTSTISTAAAFLGSPVVASNVSTTGSVVSATPVGANYVLTKSQTGLATWAPVNINVVSGVSFAYDNSMIVSTASGLYTVTSTISTAAGFLGSPVVASNTSTVTSYLGGLNSAAYASTTGSLVSAVAGGANYVLTKTTNGLATWAPPPAGGSGGSGGSSFVGDNSMIVSSVSGVYTVTSTISTAAAFLGSPIVASNVSTTGSAVSAAAAGANYVLTKTTNGLATWAPPPAGGSGGSSFVGDNSMIVSSVSGVYTVTSTISTAAAFLGSPIVASNTSTVTSYLGGLNSAAYASTTASVVSATPSGENYVLTKSQTGLATWAAPAAGGGGTSVNFMVNIVYSNTQAVATLWDSATGGHMVLDATTMNLSNATNLPTGWSLGYTGVSGTGFTSFFLSTTGALNYTARQMTPVNVRILFAKTTSGGASTAPQATAWTSMAADGDSMAISIADKGRFGDITAVPLKAGLNRQTLYSFTKGGTTYSSAVLTPSTDNWKIPGNANALLCKMYLEFDLSTAY